MKIKLTSLAVLLLAGCTHTGTGDPRVGVTPRNQIVPLVDAHQHMMGPAAMSILTQQPSPPAVTIPADLEALLTAREAGVDASNVARGSHGLIGKQNLYEHPLGPKGKNAFEHDGGESIFSLPNGFQAYYLNTADGKSLDKGPTNIVQDKRAKDLLATRGPSMRSVLVVRGANGDEVTRVTSDADGAFRVDLPPGRYAVVPQPVDGLLGSRPDRAVEQRIDDAIPARGLGERAMDEHDGGPHGQTLASSGVAAGAPADLVALDAELVETGDGDRLLNTWVFGQGVGVDRGVEPRARQLGHGCVARLPDQRRDADLALPRRDADAWVPRLTHPGRDVRPPAGRRGRVRAGRAPGRRTTR